MSRNFGATYQFVGFGRRRLNVEKQDIHVNHVDLFCPVVTIGFTRSGRVGIAVGGQFLLHPRTQIVSDQLTVAPCERMSGYENAS